MPGINDTVYNQYREIIRSLPRKGVAKLKASIDAKRRHIAGTIETFRGCDNPQVLELYHRNKGACEALSMMSELLEGDNGAITYFTELR